MSEKITNNKNFNNKRNTAKTVPVHDDATKKDEDAVVMHNEVLEDTKEVMSRYFGRSLSQNAVKHSKPSSKSFDYHPVKRDKSLPYYQRQQSKPEQGRLIRKPSLGKTSASNSHQNAAHAQGYHTLPSRPSLNELQSASKKTFLSELVEQTHAQCQSETDVRPSQNLSGVTEIHEQLSGRSILYQLMDSQPDSVDGSLFTSEHFESNPEGERHLRTDSFSIAMSSSSNFLESRKTARRKSSDDVNMHQTSHKESIRKFSLKESEIPGKSSSLHRRGSSCDVEEVLALQVPDHKEEANRPVDKKISFGDKLKKRLMPSSSSKRKIKIKKTKEQTKMDEAAESSNKGRPDCLRVPPPAEATIPSSSEIGPRSSSSKHKTTLPRDRSSSPPKSKPPVTPKLLLRSLSLKNKFSPKSKRRAPPPLFASTNALSSDSTVPSVGGRLVRNKSGSLPLSMRYGVDQAVPPAIKGRRYSEDFHQSPPPTQKSSLPLHFDLNKKSKRPSKFKRLFLRWRRRHVSESSNGSSRSHSVPSIPAAVDQEKEFLAGAGDEEWNRTEEDQPRTESDEDKLASSGEEPGVFHHRGSLSLSYGDLDGLSLPEKQKIYDEIAETLQRVSLKYKRYIQRRSSHTSRKQTSPGSSLSSQEFHRSAKESLPESLSSQASSSSIKGPVHPRKKSFRQYKNDNQPALTAFYNMRSQGKVSDLHLDKMPRPLHTRRHIRHKATGSLDSPFASERHVRSRVDGFSKLVSPPISTTEETKDSVDGSQPTNSTKPTSGDGWEPEDECTETDCAVRSFHSRNHVMLDTTAVHRSIASSHHGSDVDVPSYRSSMQPAGHLLMASRPSTSTMPDLEEPSDGPSPEPIDEDKLVDLLVQALCDRGDEYIRKIDMPNGLPLEPVFRSSMIRYMSRVTYHHFEHFAKRFCQNVKQITETSATRHSEVFPVVMVFSMTELIVNMARSDATQSAVNRVLSLSSQLLSNIVQNQGNNWGAVLAQLQTTEVQLAEEEVD